MRKKWGLAVGLLLLTGCEVALRETPVDQQVTRPIGMMNEMPADLAEIEGLLIRVELEAGLGQTDIALDLLNELVAITTTTSPTVRQQSRILTMKDVLAFSPVTQEVTEELSLQKRGFSGSDAAISVFNMIGWLPEGYTLVYHEVPAVVGMDGVGFYVYMVPVDHHLQTSVSVRERFFVTEHGEILVFD